MSRPSEVREPFYFGDEGRRLYACLHAAPRPRPGAPAVLICPPLGQESMRSHRALVQLAVRLSREGLPAMRFDYFGCGDSEGTLLDVELDGLATDIHVAAAELARRSRAPSIAFVALRAGAAALLRSADLRPAAVALWDPLVVGRRYLDQLERDHARMLANSYVNPKRAIRDGEIVERLGYRYPRSLLDSLGKLDLVAGAAASAAALGRPRAGSLVLDGGADPAAERLASSLGVAGWNSRFVSVEGPQVWSEEPYKGLIPAAALDALVSWAGEIAG